MVIAWTSSAKAGLSCASLFANSGSQVQIWLHGEILKDSSDKTSKQYQKESRRVFDLQESGIRDEQL